jgi:GH35 family endo-1,4-beta-xylanase
MSLRVPPASGAPPRFTSYRPGPVRFSLCALAVSLLVSHLIAAESPLPPGGVSLLSGDTVSSFQLWADPAIVAPIEVVPATGQPFRQALRLRTLANTDTPYTVQLHAATAAPVHVGDVLYATFYLRSPDSKDEGGATEMAIEQGPPAYRKLAEMGGSAGPVWRQIAIRFMATRENIGDQEIPAGKANILFRLGYGPQTIEIGGVQILNFGATVRLQDLPPPIISYAGSEPDAPWRKAAGERIERIRKAPLSVVVKDSAGRPVPGATVSVNMLRHAFGFGSAVSAAGILDQSPDGAKYRDTILKYFNKVVMENDLKWRDWEENRQRAIDGVTWLRAHGIAVRGHNLVWPSWKNMPDDLAALKDNPAALRKRVDDHILDEVTAMKGQCVEWDVVNEPYSNHDLTDILGKDAIAQWYRLAHQADPAAKLYINDYDTVESGRQNNPHTDFYEQTIRSLLDHGVPLSGIGIQSHFAWNLPAPVAVLKGLDRFALLGREIEITEHDIDVTDEQLQADYTRDYLTLAFSHPAVTGFLSWGFWEGRHWKPAGRVRIDLVRNKWWTRVSGVTDSRGAYNTRGFLGDYEITVTCNGKSKSVHTTLRKDSPPVDVVME